MAYVKGRTGSNPVIVLGDLDFQKVRTSLRGFLQKYDQFSDYDFEGSALSTIIDLLTYNTAFYSFYANMVANESFLDTATRYSSVASLTKPLSYLPHSAVSSKCTLTVKNNSASDVTLSPYTSSFTSGGNFNWVPTTFYTVSAGESREIDLQQGTWQTSPLGVLEQSLQPHQTFSVPTPASPSGTDISTLKIYAQENDSDGLVGIGDFDGGGVGDEYTNIRQYPEGLEGVTGGTPIYLLTTGYDGGYEIYFGDNILGKLPLDGAVIRGVYLQTSGELANGQTSFLPRAGSQGIQVVNTVTPGVGGLPPEDIESIKIKAPLFFQSQGRAVTANDLVSIITQENTGVIASAWGGEDQDPPQYGKVYISAASVGGGPLTRGQEEAIIELCNKKSVVSILPIFTEPNVINVEIDGEVYYDPFSTTTPASELSNKIGEYVQRSQIMDFNRSFSYSQFAVGILELDAGFVGDQLQVRITKLFEASNDEPLTAVSFTANNELAQSGGIAGTILNINDLRIRDEEDDIVQLYIVDNGNGILNAYRRDNNSLYKRNCGSVDYRTGRVQLDGFTIIDNFKIELRPKTNNIFAKANTLLNLQVGPEGIVLLT